MIHLPTKSNEELLYLQNSWSVDYKDAQYNNNTKLAKTKFQHLVMLKIEFEKRNMEFITSIKGLL